MSDTNNAKLFLRRYQSLLVTIRNLEAEIKEMESIAMSATGHVEYANIEVTSSNGKKRIERQRMERVQTSGTGDITDLIAGIADAGQKVMQQRTEALKELHKIAGIIKQVENKDYRQLLHRRYIEGYTWEKIAVAMNYSYRSITRMHGRALQEIDKIIDVS